MRTALGRGFVVATLMAQSMAGDPNFAPRFQTLVYQAIVD